MKYLIYLISLFKMITANSMKYCIHCKFCKLHIENNPSYDIKPVKFGLCTYFPTKIDEQYHQNTGEHGGTNACRKRRAGACSQSEQGRIYD